MKRQQRTNERVERKIPVYRTVAAFQDAFADRALPRSNASAPVAKT